MREVAHHAPLLPRHVAAWLARARRQVGRAIIHLRRGAEWSRVEQSGAEWSRPRRASRVRGVRACVHACVRACVRACGVCAAGGLAHDAIGDHALETYDEHVWVVEGARPGEVGVVVLALHRGHEGL